ncbi:MAG: asparagine synthase (glutamine-hydrolyzing), partial [Gemmatimonadetes bacterium]|nr:asparagine synthase (glutamine-hydrolyzing) [Gemmatimonadota bacterium]
MCGIAGFLRLDGAGADARELVPMVRALAHRGPDDDGVFVSGPVALGHRRLSIVDLSAAGHQPMLDESGESALVYNGEIYNHDELRRELESGGRRFRSRTDTEVLLQGLAEWDEERLLHRLNGMFAFAWWDGTRLLLARDRLGIKPLYTAEAEGLFLFASELKAIVAHPAFTPSLDPVALHHYLAFYVVPQPHSLLSGAAALPPAHTRAVDLGGARAPKRWWSPPAEIEPERSFRQWRDRVRSSLEESVRRRKMGDVDVGAFLSGGTDSSAVVALMRRAVEGDLHTFSIGFGEEGAELDELPHARAVAERWGTRHRERRLSGEDVAA